MSKILPRMPIGCLPPEQRYVKTITTASKKDEKEEERQMKFYPFTKDMT
jgi:hypothetical protein